MSRWNSDSLPDCDDKLPGLRSPVFAQDEETGPGQPPGVNRQDGETAPEVHHPED